MKKKSTYCCTCLILALASVKTQAQNFIFPAVATDASCYDGSAYTLHSKIEITAVKVTQVYYDDGTSTGTNNSFAYEIIFTYDNLFEGTVNSTGNFYTYAVTMYSQNPLAGGTITNNGSNVPLTNNIAADMNLHNNPTYHYSASQLGLEVGVLYTAAETIAIFGYDSVSLYATAPCLTVNVGNNAEGTIPLHLSQSDLSANMIDNKVALLWNTETETDNAGFIVQKSKDSKNWDDLMGVPSKALHGNSITPITYTVIDEKPETGNNFYRFIQMDINGHEAMSNIAMVTNNSIQKEVLIYPNPACNRVHIKSKTALLNEPFYLKNMMGETIKTGHATTDDLKLDVADLANGNYILQVGNNKEMVTVVH